MPVSSGAVVTMQAWVAVHTRLLEAIVIGDLRRAVFGVSHEVVAGDVGELRCDRKPQTRGGSLFRLEQ